jgi:ribosomal protein L29
MPKAKQLQPAKAVEKKEVKTAPEKVEKKAEGKEQTIQSLRQQIARQRVEMSVGKVKDVRSISKLRDQLARQLTIQRMKELGEV